MALRIEDLRGSCQCGNNNPDHFWVYSDENRIRLLGVACKKRKCGTEYLTEELYPGVSSQIFIVANGISLYRKSPTVLVLDSEFQVRLDRDRALTVTDLVPGDHVGFDRWYLIWHHAIVMEVSPEPFRLVVEGWDGNALDMKRKQKEISEDELQYMYKFNYSREVEMQNPPQLVLARCRARRHDGNDYGCYAWPLYFGRLEEGYGFFNENCEHNATYARTGQRASNQSSWLWVQITRLSLHVGPLILKALLNGEVGTLLATEVFENLLQGVFEFANTALFESIGLIGLVGIESYAFYKAYKQLKHRLEINEIDNHKYRLEMGRRIFEFVFTVIVAGGGGILAASFTSTAAAEIILAIILYVLSKMGTRLLTHFMSDDLLQWIADRANWVLSQSRILVNYVFHSGMQLVNAAREELNTLINVALAIISSWFGQE